jgi:hypothetical protein
MERGRPVTGRLGNRSTSGLKDCSWHSHPRVWSCQAVSGSAANAMSAMMNSATPSSRAAADWIVARRAQNPSLCVAVIAAGERWPDKSLRPAVEDLWGAGALIDALHTVGWTAISLEAHPAAAAFQTIADDLEPSLRNCASGQELIDIGYADDVRTAGELDDSRSVPLLLGNARWSQARLDTGVGELAYVLVRLPQIPSGMMIVVSGAFAQVARCLARSLFRSAPVASPSTRAALEQ